MSTPFILAMTLGGRCNYQSHCVEKDTEAVRGCDFPRPKWYVVLGLEFTVLLARRSLLELYNRTVLLLD